MNFYVYSILDPRKPGVYKYNDLEFSYEPIYIGKGKNNRLYQHTKLYNLNKYDSYKDRKLKKIINEGFKPIIVKLKENLIEQDALNLEKEYISKIKRYPDGPLTNLTDGGDGVSGLKHTPESKEKMSKTWFNETTAPWNKGMQMPKEYCDKLSKSHLGHKLSEETIEKLSHIRKGKLKSEEHKQKIRESLCKNTYRIISPEGQEFVVNNYNEFCKEHNLSPSTMCRILHGYKKSCNGGWTGWIK